MKPYTTIALGIATAILFNSSKAKAGEIFRACGPKASGVIFVNGQKACISGWGGGGGGNADGSAFRQGITELSEKRASLAYKDCGSPPNYSDYGLSWQGDGSDKLANTLLKRDREKWQKCVDRVMETKYPKEDKEIKAQMLEAFKTRNQ